jgi:hypothetical protein
MPAVNAPIIGWGAQLGYAMTEDGDPDFTPIAGGVFNPLLVTWISYIASLTPPSQMIPRRELTSIDTVDGLQETEPGWYVPSQSCMVTCFYNAAFFSALNEFAIEGFEQAWFISINDSSDRVLGNGTLLYWSGFVEDCTILDTTPDKPMMMRITLSVSGQISIVVPA